MNKFQFFSITQIEEMRKAVLAGKSPKEIAETFHNKWNRSKMGIYQKAHLIKRNPNKFITKPNSVVKEIGVKLPEGFIFEGKTNKVEIYSDHFRIYF